MNLESAVKYHFAKTTSISDAPSSTSPDRLTGTDVMGAFGYCQSKESFGFSAFSGKMEISQNDKVKSDTTFNSACIESLRQGSSLTQARYEC